MLETYKYRQGSVGISSTLGLKQHHTIQLNHLKSFNWLTDNQQEGSLGSSELGS